MSVGLKIQLFAVIQVFWLKVIEVVAVLRVGEDLPLLLWRLLSETACPPVVTVTVAGEASN